MKKTKNQKGGKILGRGRDGCVTYPAYMCLKKFDPETHVSKLIDLNQVEEKIILDEFKLGKFFLKNDKMHRFFLPYKDICNYSIEEKKITSKNQKKFKDMQDCGYSKDGIINTVSLILPKGTPFDLKNMSLKDKIFATYHCALIINKLSKMEMLHLDIKQDNMLMYNNHPTLIDFTPDFVFPNTIQDIANFSDWFGRRYYFPWPPELYLLTHFLRTDLHRQNILDSSLLSKDLLKIYKKMHGFSMMNEEDLRYIWDLFKNDIKLFMDKVMIYSIGMSLMDACGDIFPNILHSFIENDITTRPSSYDLIKLMKPYILKNIRVNQVTINKEKNKVLSLRNSLKKSTSNRKSIKKDYPSIPKNIKSKKISNSLKKSLKITPLPKTPSLPKSLYSITPLPKTPSPPFNKI